MIERIKTLARQYRSLIAYGFFGVCTTVINVLVYDGCYYLLHIANVPSTCIAWLLAVLFAFVTNKLFVFESRSREKKVLLYELGTFFLCRALTGLLDVGIMYVCVDRLGYNPTLFKLLSNVVVIILNYIASKLLIFRRQH